MDMDDNVGQDQVARDSTDGNSENSDLVDAHQDGDDEMPPESNFGETHLRTDNLVTVAGHILGKLESRPEVDRKLTGSTRLTLI